MDFFKYFTTGITLATVDKFSKNIKSTLAYKYFSDSDTQMVSDYKDFYVTTISSAMAVIALEMDLKNPSNKKDIQTVYIGKSAEFIRKIMSVEYKIPELKVDKRMADRMFKGDIESHLCFQTHVLFEDIIKEVKQSLDEKSAFYFMKYDMPFFNEDTGENELGETRLFSYLWNMMLAKEGYDYEDYENEKMIISHNSFTELNEDETKLLNTFVTDLYTFLKD
jgi:hypothetical protein